MIVAIASDKEERVKKDNYSKYVDAKNPDMAKRRKNEILDMYNYDPQLTVQEVSERLGISFAMARTYLEELEHEEAVVKHTYHNKTHYAKR